MFWELVEDNNEDKKIKICNVFNADVDLEENGTDVDTIILQCNENYGNCIFYYDCNPFDMSTEDFMECVNEL